MAEMYKQASKMGLRIPTTKGNLSVEQLWDLNLPDLDKTAVALKKAYNTSGGESFLDANATKDKTIKLQFDITLDVLETKQELAKRAATRAANKARNQKILAIIEEKKDAALGSKSIKQLTEMLEEDDEE